MKKILVYALTLLLASSLAGCSKSAADPNAAGQSGQNQVVEKELFDVKVNLPVSLFEGKDFETIKKEALEKGIHDVIQNSDETITYVMSKTQHQEMMNSMAKSIDDAIAEFLGSEANSKIFKQIEFTKDYTELNVKVDPTQFNGWSQLSLLGFTFSSLMYQSFNGVATDQITLKTNIIDNSTGAVISTSTYPDQEAAQDANTALSAPPAEPAPQPAAAASAPAPQSAAVQTAPSTPNPTPNSSNTTVHIIEISPNQPYSGGYSSNLSMEAELAERANIQKFIQEQGSVKIDEGPKE